MQLYTPRAKRDEERILPLINIVFLLLIFFMLAGQFSTSDPLGITPPVSLSQTPAPSPRALVLIAADGRIALDGMSVSEAQLTEFVQARLAAGGVSELYVRADGRASAARVIAIMERLRSSGVEKLRLLTIATTAETR